MAWFTCMAGVGGKGNSVIVTCDADFAGIPITCTNGQKTYTKVCPSFSPYEVTFSGLVAGTWTISATVDGVVYSTTAVVTDITAVLSYGFNWQKWVDNSSSLDSGDYTDLADLLGDEAAIRQLFIEHAPTDYAASTATVTPDLATVLNNNLCAKWINLNDYALDTLYANPLIAAAMDSADKYFYGEWGIVDDTTTPVTWGPKGNVPVMTSNSAPYGVASASSIHSSTYDVWKAFDGNPATDDRWSASSTSGWIQYKFTNPVCAKRMYIYWDSGYSGTCQLKASNDGSNWTNIGESFSFASQEGRTIELNNSDYYLYYRVDGSAVNGGYTLKTLQFYGRELSVSVPTMTSNTTPYGEAICGAVLSGATQQAWVSFDKVINSDGYETPNNAVSAGTAWLGYKFLNKTNVKMVTISNRTGYSGGDLHAFISGKLQGRNNDNEEWEDIETITRTNYSTAGITTAHIISNSGSYSQLRVKADTTLSNNGRLHIAELQFYGFDYSEKEFEIGATKKWIYDHGVELETLEKNTYERSDYWGGGSLVKGEHSFIVTTPNKQYGCDSAVTTSMIDITPYSLYRAKIFNMSGSLASGSNGNKLFMMVNQNKANPDDNRIALFEPTDNKCLPNYMALSISSISQSVYLWAGRTLSNNQTVEYTELWLE